MPATRSDAQPPGRQTRMILVTLKNPVALPVSLVDAIRLGGIEKISAFEEDLAVEAKECPGREGA